MSDIIKLLPDSVANQIAAGEVIQRPASVVKELLENAIDAGADQIKLIIKDAGKALIQVIDNGCGMSDTDARMCWERHATSKINDASDLFKIRTKGFRGEALASIAAVAQVEMKTRRHDDETGTLIQIEDSVVKLQEQTVTQPGTGIAVRNLFFNTPARRNFLKSNAQELRHIIEEFQRVALVHCDINFSLHHEGLEIFNLKSGSFRQRICAIFGSNYNERLVPVLEDTEFMHISGFICKPEFAKKTRGEQYFFANNRFIRDSYLNHAVVNAYDGMIPKDSYASYFINIAIDPSKIDVNVHPTKTEIKFEDERMVYAFMRASVKHALGKFSLAPSLNFDAESMVEIPLQKLKELPKTPGIIINPEYNPFKPSQQEKPGASLGMGFERNTVQRDWQKLYEGLDVKFNEQTDNSIQQELHHDVIADEEIIFCSQIDKSFIVCVLKNKILIIDQQAAHERILFSQQVRNLKNPSAQQQLFPQTLALSADDYALMQEIEPDLKQMGFDISPFGNNAYVLHGAPLFIDQSKQIKVIESILDQFKHNAKSFRIDKAENIARTVARSLAIKAGEALSEPEMKNLVSELFKCDNPTTSIYGRLVIIQLDAEYLKKLF